MFNEVLRGSLAAFVICVLSVFSLYAKLIPPYYFAAVLAAWSLYSAHRLFGLVGRRFAATHTHRPDKDAIGYWLGAVGSSLVAPLLWMLVVSQIFGGQWNSANESAAVGRLRDLNNLQHEYAADYPEKGFACALPLLEHSEKPPNRTDYDPGRFLVTGTWSGYNFAVVSCNPNAEGMVSHYQATAVPSERGKTGSRAFCTDDSGELWYDRSGSAAECLLSRRSLLTQ